MERKLHLQYSGILSASYDSAGLCINDDDDDDDGDDDDVKSATNCATAD